MAGLKVFLALCCMVAATQAVQLERKPFKRLIPADVLRGNFFFTVLVSLIMVFMSLIMVLVVWEANTAIQLDGRKNSFLLQLSFVANLVWFDTEV